MFALLFAELYRIARGRMPMEWTGQSLEATGLVDGAWLRLENPLWRSGKLRESFLSEACRGDAELRLEVERLLTKARQAESPEREAGGTVFKARNDA